MPAGARLDVEAHRLAAGAGRASHEKHETHERGTGMMPIEYIICAVAALWLFSGCVGWGD
jgi:hypothetical protein